jgi:hypothetical protein
VLACSAELLGNDPHSLKMINEFLNGFLNELF